jgi:hypothetical protein
VGAFGRRADAGQRAHDGIAFRRTALESPGVEFIPEKGSGAGIRLACSSLRATSGAPAGLAFSQAGSTKRAAVVAQVHSVLAS